MNGMVPMNATDAADLISGLKDAMDTSMYDGENGGSMDDAIDLAVEALAAYEGANAPTSLYTLMAKQERMMNLLGVGRPVLGWRDGNLLAETLTLLAGEAHEAIAPLLVKTKPWKQAKSEGELEAEVSKEVTDILFFLLEAFIQMKWTPETVVAWYELKYQENVKRIQQALGTSIP